MQLGLCEACVHMFNSRDPHGGKREPATASFPLTSTGVDTLVNPQDNCFSITSGGLSVYLEGTLVPWNSSGSPPGATQGTLNDTVRLDSVHRKQAAF